MTVTAPEALPGTGKSTRLRSTPYARRLARERQVPLAALAGTGPGGRILGRDVVGFTPANSPPASQPDRDAPIATVAAPLPALPEALAIRVEFGALAKLVETLAPVAAALSERDIILKAAALALDASPAWRRHGTAILLSEDGRSTSLDALATASLTAVSTLRTGGGVGTAALALSFINRKGVRPVSARLAGDAPARLIVGGMAADGSAECLLAYDPDRIDAGTAADFLDALRGLLETPLRILV